jgi:hypothetical protein
MLLILTDKTLVFYQLIVHAAIYQLIVHAAIYRRDILLFVICLSLIWTFSILLFVTTVSLIFGIGMHNVSTIYRGSQFYWWRKQVYPEKTTDLP